MSSDIVVAVALHAEALLALSRMTGIIGSEDRSKQRARELSDRAFELAEQLDDDDFTIRAL